MISIMAILATVLVLNLAGQRAERDVQIAENELVSNIRQIQGNTLSARTLPGGQSPQYYLMKFDLKNPKQYTAEAIYNVSSGSPQLTDIQTFILPPDVQIGTIASASFPITISRPGAIIPTTLTLPGVYGNCGLVAFAAPFGKTMLDSSCSIASAPSISSGDDYYYIVNFVSNIPCASSNLPSSPPSPAGCAVSTDSLMTITLVSQDHTYSKTVTVNAVTGSVSFN